MNDKQVVTMLGLIPVLIGVGFGLFGILYREVGLLIFASLVLVVSVCLLLTARDVMDMLGV